MDAIVGGGEGESIINLLDLYFSFFVSTWHFFDSSLGFLNMTFNAALDLVDGPYHLFIEALPDVY